MVLPVYSSSMMYMLQFCMSCKPLQRMQSIKVVHCACEVTNHNGFRNLFMRKPCYQMLTDPRAAAVSLTGGELRIPQGPETSWSTFHEVMLKDIPETPAGQGHQVGAAVKGNRTGLSSCCSDGSERVSSQVCRCRLCRRASESGYRPPAARYLLAEARSLESTMLCM